ncbi:MAG: hypothetical protein ACAH35_05620 [Candidatus Paceibacterota bacterium]
MSLFYHPDKLDRPADSDRRMSEVNAAFDLLDKADDDALMNARAQYITMYGVPSSQLVSVLSTTAEERDIARKENERLAAQLQELHAERGTIREEITRERLKQEVARIRILAPLPPRENVKYVVDRDRTAEFDINSVYNSTIGGLPIYFEEDSGLDKPNTLLTYLRVTAEGKVHALFDKHKLRERPSSEWIAQRMDYLKKCSAVMERLPLGDGCIADEANLGTFHIHIGQLLGFCSRFRAMENLVNTEGIADPPLTRFSDMFGIDKRPAHESFVEAPIPAASFARWYNEALVRSIFLPKPENNLLTLPLRKGEEKDLVGLVCLHEEQVSTDSGDTLSVSVIPIGNWK